ncbi:hypothetical protein PVT68_17515 [Microbulbifer bruguierae]|uniref:Uncharacterized protein n=1 Tax=Microbulbifer bruguierae TaxID=3029061 RepID=A0ABY8NFN3_9GAMM|nr:hypothetical protein [Microbulbifer bruguierae]WGL16547.1 hypothetical protein PVT68_17515 [Microbulbifer bruguierae]
MNSKHWQNDYRRAINTIRSPALLDEKVLAGIGKIQPVRAESAKGHRTLSKVASGFSAIAIAIVMLHPAQYIDAAQGQQAAPAEEKPGAEQYKPTLSLAPVNLDGWHILRAEVDAGNYVELCAQWRQQQRTTDVEPLPNDLKEQARGHCRILP